MSIPTPVAVFWFRRDLRLHDNAGLYHALKSGWPVLPVFIFDRQILDGLTNREDARVTFIHQTIATLQTKLTESGSGLWTFYGNPVELWRELIQRVPVAAVYTNADAEPYALERDAAVAALLAEKGIALKRYKDHLIFDHTEILKSDGTPYTVFTPYSKRWLEKLDTRLVDGTSFYLRSYPTEKYWDRLVRAQASEYGRIPDLQEMGFMPSTMEIPPATVSQSLIAEYDKRRDFPAVPGTSKLGIHFRFGTISIREKARKARQLNGVYLNELIWRDFFSQVLAHFPHVAHRAFKPAYDRVPWRDAASDFERWCEGKTGYPMVDAGMRELNATGFMHNRVRMITAGFLTKHLLIDWRHGEAYFAEKLLDFDLASNNGGWQWAAGCGTDAAPYFRIFNPAEQQKKFDPDGAYIRRWVPEYGTGKYPSPMVDHVFARQRCLEAYKKAL